MSFVVHNDGFTCKFCEAQSPPAPKTCRNHCRECLCSVHVDLENPGDRLSGCLGKMIPKKVEPDAKRIWMIVHQCEQCKKIQRNKAAEDDNFEKLVEISKKSADGFWKGDSDFDLSP